MKYKEVCECCGQQKTAYTLPLNQGLVGAFIKFAEKFLENHEPISKGKIGLTNAQYSNFQNLRHYGIIKQYEKGNEWYLTDLGEAFYYGEVGLMSPVAFMAGVTLDDNHPCWQSEKNKRVMVGITEILSTHYKRRPEYVEEKSNQNQLF